MLRDLVDATHVSANYIYIDPSPEYQAQARRREELGLRPTDRLSSLLTDLNIRAYVNQQLADFLGLPYVSAAARVPFRKHLYERAVAVQRQLQAVDLIDARYAEVVGDVQLRLPVFLALAIREAERPADLWAALAKLRQQAKPYRAVRKELDAALARRDLEQAKSVAKALSTEVDNIFAVAGDAVARAGWAVVGEVAKGDVTDIATGVAAVEAASRRLLSSSVVDRIIWRLRRPHLLWLNNVMDEAKHIAEALPDAARIWRIPEREQARFALRFSKMGELQAGQLPTDAR